MKTHLVTVSYLQPDRQRRATKDTQINNHISMDFGFHSIFLLCYFVRVSVCQSVSVSVCMEFACSIVIMFDFIWSFIILHTNFCTGQRRKEEKTLWFFHSFFTMILYFVAHTHRASHQSPVCLSVSIIFCDCYIEFLNRFEQRQLASILLSLAFQNFQFHSIINWMFYERSNKT